MIAKCRPTHGNYSMHAKHTHTQTNTGAQWNMNKWFSCTDKTTTSQDALAHMHSTCVHVLAAKHHTHSHTQVNDMHIFMQAACDDTDMDAHTETRASPVLTDVRVVRHYTHIHACHGHTHKYMETLYINGACSSISHPLHVCRQVNAKASHIFVTLCTVFSHGFASFFLRKWPKPFCWSSKISGEIVGLLTSCLITWLLLLFLCSQIRSDLLTYS